MPAELGSINVSKKSVSQMEQIRIPTERRIRFGMKRYEDKIKNLEDQISRANLPEDRKNLDRQLEIAYAEQDIFLWEHDTTGAKKEALFGSALRQTVESLGVKENDSGELEVQSMEKLRRTHICTVNVGELDRINKEGEHALGDQALNMAFQRIEARIKEVYARASQARGETVKEEDLYAQYEVFRIGSNDFSIILKNADAELADRVVESLSESMPLPEKYKLDPMPFAASHVALDKSYGILKDAKNRKEQKGLSENAGGMTEWIGIIRNQSQAMNDFEKVRSRLNRIAEKIEKNEEGAKPLYDQFLKKTLGRLFVEGAEEDAQSFEDFKKTITDLGAFDKRTQPEWQENIFKTAEKEAMNLLKTSAAERIKSQTELEQKVLEEFKEHAEDIGLETELEKGKGKREKGSPLRLRLRRATGGKSFDKLRIREEGE